MQNSSKSGLWKRMVRSGKTGRESGDVSGSRNWRIFYTLAGLLLLFLFWLFRPGDPPPVVTTPAAIPGLDFPVSQAGEAIRRAELEAGPLRPDNHARIIWNQEYQNRKAPCSVVYLHGFSASFGEGAPVHARVARDLGCHLYVSRLHAHGLRTDEPLADFRADSLLASAGHALAVGNLLGDKVILIGNSMGGTLAIHLAASHPERVDVLVLLSPLIDFATPVLRMLSSTWAQRLAGLYLGEPFIRIKPESDDHARYWYSRYRIESLTVLNAIRQELLSDDVYAQIRQPVFAGYYYKDASEQDAIVSVSAIREMETKLGTPVEQREFAAFPAAEAHVISSAYRSTEHAQVSDALAVFLQEQLSDY